MPDRLIILERQFAAIIESVENYAANQKPKICTEDYCVLTDVIV